MATEGAMFVHDSTSLRYLPTCLSKMFSIVIILQFLIFSTPVHGDIRCVCNTPDCKHSGSSTCVAKYFCFIEYSVVGRHYKPTVRGCIDKRTPINCEQFVPHDQTGRMSTNWPYMFCCSDGWCNTDRRANRRVQFQPSLKRNKKRPFQSEESKDQRATDKPLAAGDELSNTRSKYDRTPPLSPNPAHIAVPVAGAFFVLSLVVLVIILVRRKEAEENNRAMSNKYQSVPASIMVQMKTAGVRENPYQDPPTPIPLYASVGSKPGYPLCPVVTRAPV